MPLKLMILQRIPHRKNQTTLRTLMNQMTHQGQTEIQEVAEVQVVPMIQRMTMKQRIQMKIIPMVMTTLTIQQIQETTNLFAV